MKTKLNLGCGDKPLKGFINSDYIKTKNVDIVVDLNNFPYPWESNSIDYINCDDTLEHLKEPERFWHEIHRILKLGARIKVKVPHYKSIGAYACFGHRSYFHENAIDSLCPTIITSEDNSTCRGFKLIEKRVTRGRFFRWQKREIIWVVEKIFLQEK
ncbi:methyltransferase domain-containing protein [Candidatus Pacearchaeota archaeon]|nr:methyltransferase domain-containing protein [Candidatus Pacearchaeota archaeon]